MHTLIVSCYVGFYVGVVSLVVITCSSVGIPYVVVLVCFAHVLCFFIYASVVVGAQCLSMVGVIDGCCFGSLLDWLLFLVACVSLLLLLLLSCVCFLSATRAARRQTAA